MERPGIEYRYDIQADAALPSLGEVDAGLTVRGPVETEFEAVYFDTADLALARHGATLRQRAGGEDERWHLTLPAGGETCAEFREPLGDDEHSVPEPLLAAVRAVARGRTLTPVVIVRTKRTERHLLDGDGRDVASVADETVNAERLGPSASVLTWREVHVQSIDGEQALLEALRRQLESGGLRPAPARSTLARVLDESLLTAASAPLSPKSPAGTVVAQYLREQIHELISRDRGARADVPDAVHKMRVATRRLRSALATYRPLLHPDGIEPLREELAWLGAVLGEPRDAEVLRDRLRVAVSGFDDELVLGPVTARIETEMIKRHSAAHKALIQALDGDRYLHLLDDLEALVETPSFTDRGRRPARRELSRLVTHACRRVDRAAVAAEHAEGTAAHPVRLHDVRKAAKRARYACESVSPVFGPPARRLAGRMETVQEILGEHQDSVVASQIIRELAIAACGARENSFTFGVLHAYEADRAASALQAYAPALRACQKKTVRRWLQ